jgi:hypothetical protein
MNRKIIIIVALCLVFTIGGMVAYATYRSSLSDAIVAIDDGFVIGNSLSDKLRQLEEVSAISNIVTNYTYQDFRLLGVANDGEINRYVSSAPRSLVAVNAWYPVEHLHYVDENTLYIVYRLTDDTIGEYYAYCFFSKLDPIYESAPEGTELWWISGRVIFVSRRLSQQDFADIGTGTSLEQVEAVNPLTKLCHPQDIVGIRTAERWNEDIGEYETYEYEPEPLLSFKTYHYLEEGLLCIVFSRESVDDEWTVSEMGLNESFEVPAGFSNGGTVKLEIYSEDLPIADA